MSNARDSGLRVAVIDSGVNPSHSHIDVVAGGVGVGPNGEIETGEGAYLDQLGHGTAVMAAIQEKAPHAQYFAVRVFHTALRTKAAALLRALDWCIDQKMDVVNLSLGTISSVHATLFEAAAIRASAAGTLLVAAREANGERCYPGCLPTVFSVGLDWDCPRERFRHESTPDGDIFYASGYPRPIPGVAPTRNLYGISFAVANMTGFVARAFSVDHRSRSANQRAAAVKEALLT